VRFNLTLLYERINMKIAKCSECDNGLIKEYQQVSDISFDLMEDDGTRK